MTKRGLTGNERRVLHGLVARPTLNDRELSEVLGVKVSTVTAIRRRLRRAEFFITRRVPMMHRLGWELLAGGYARLDVAQGPQAAGKVREILRERLPNLFHVVASSDHMSFLAAEPDYTSLHADVDELRVHLDRAKLLGNGDLHFCVFPVRLTVVPAFFDYSHVLALAFGLEHRVSFKIEPPKTGDVDLTKKETEVLKGLVRYPELSDKALAQKVKVSRQAVSKMRKEFEAEDLVRTVRLPNLRALGFEIYVTSFAHFTPKGVLRAREEAMEKLLRIAPVFFLMSSNADAILLSAAKNYEQFSVLRATVTRYLEERGFLVGEPFVHVGLTASVELLRNCDFASLMSALPGPEVRRGR